MRGTVCVPCVGLYVSHAWDYACPIRGTVCVPCVGLVRRNRRGRPRHIEGFLDGNTKKSRRGDTGNLRFFYREEEAAPDRERDAAYRDWLGKYRLADNA